MNKNIVLAIALGVLVIVAGLQAYQLFGLKEKILDSGVNLKSTSSKVSSGSGTGSSAPAPSLDALPQMVGGC